ncbi:MAG: CPBP family intramembrane metalloprotease [Pirellulaceae bacterium]|nr:CPBP family intramembrane metalloprotease [Pirellulaceae bacterium]
MDNSDNVTLSEEQLWQHPELAFLIFLFGLLVLLVLVSFLSTWIFAISRWMSGKNLLVVRPWTPRVWGLAELVLVAILVVVGQVVSLSLWAQATGTNLKDMKQESAFPLSAMAAVSATYLVVMLVVTLWMVVRYQATLKHIGLGLNKLLANIGVGLMAAAMSLPIVWSAMVAVSAGFDEDYSHPLLEQLTEEGSVLAYLLAVFCAVIVAPLAEEFLFRVMLQGWLQSLPWSFRSLWWLLGADGVERQQALGIAAPAALAAELVESSDEAALPEHANPYAAPASLADQPLSPPVVVGAGSQSVAEQPSVKPPLWPVFVSGTLFGLAHFDYGLSFIPLILLGIVLGLLYRATHSIWPCFVLHFCLNGIAMLGMGLSLVIKSVQ